MESALPRHRMWQGSTVAVLQTVYNMMMSNKSADAAIIIETYLRHLGEWT
jgi:hypothetical protein